MIQSLRGLTFTTKAQHSLLHIFHIVQYGDDDLLLKRNFGLSMFFVQFFHYIRSKLIEDWTSSRLSLVVTFILLLMIIVV